MLKLNIFRNSNWNPNNGFRFIIHGWQMNANTNMNIAITRELLARADHNVVVVDWSRGKKFFRRFYSYR